MTAPEIAARPRAGASAVAYVSPRIGWGVLRVTGSEAATFLHGQLSSDVSSLAPGEGRYWSYNSPKGRMLANGVLWRSPAGARETAFIVLLAADLAATLAQRLSLYVLRASVAIDDATSRYALLGVAGEENADAVHDAFGIATTPLAAVPFDEDASAFMLPDRRIVIAAPRAEGPLLQAALARHAATVDCDAWRAFGIEAGVAWITAATSDRFVPQTANFDLVGGVDFRKGCYPGQEIIARMRYLGRLKERLFRFDVDAQGVAIDARLYSRAFGEQPCGTVVDAVPLAGRGSSLLAVVQLAAVADDDLTLGAPDGPRLARRPLPYDVPEAPQRAVNRP